jgi:hypothetical protein
MASASAKHISFSDTALPLLRVTVRWRAQCTSAKQPQPHTCDQPLVLCLCILLQFACLLDLVLLNNPKGPADMQGMHNSAPMSMKL